VTALSRNTHNQKSKTTNQTNEDQTDMGHQKCNLLPKMVRHRQKCQYGPTILSSSAKPTRLHLEPCTARHVLGGPRTIRRPTRYTAPRPLHQVKGSAGQGIRVDIRQPRGLCIRSCRHAHARWPCQVGRSGGPRAGHGGTHVRQGGRQGSSMARPGSRHSAPRKRGW
jgi:hypothetical protein